MVFKNLFGSDVFPILRFPWACLFAGREDAIFIQSHHVENGLADTSKKNECDLLTQASQAIQVLKHDIAIAGFSFNDIARVEVLLSPEVMDDQLPGLFEMLEVFPGEVEINYRNSPLLFNKPRSIDDKLISIEVMLVH